MKFHNLQKIDFFPISKRKLNNFGPGVQHGGTSRRSGGHWVNPRNTKFGCAPLREMKQVIIMT